MKKLLVVVDMQKDFVDGALANENAMAIVPAVQKFVGEWKDDIVFTRDTHTKEYMETLEGKKLPVKHCVTGTEGHELIPELKPFADRIEQNGGRAYIDKPVFGAEELGRFVRDNGYDEVTLIGVCTGICVISNAVVVRTFNPETDVNVVANLCACLTPETHQTALDAMKTFQVNII